MKRRTFLLSLLISAPAFAAPGAGDLLRSMEGAEKSLSYSATALVTRGSAPPMTIQIWRDGAKRRLEWSAPQIMRGDVLVDDGRSVWRYHRAENSAVQTRGTGEMDWGKLSRSMQPAMAGSGNVAGRAAWIVALTARGARQPTLKVWIDQKNLARLRVDRLDASGKASRSYAVQSIRFGDVPASRFSWTPPAGARVTRTSGTLYSDLSQAHRAASWLQVPDFVPPGYEFESAVVDPAGNGGAGEAWLRYANGINRFSVFQQRTGDNKVFAAQRQGAGWFIQRGGSRFMVLGLPDAEARRVIESLR
jgi:negative regulator of sigma E activity